MELPVSNREGAYGNIILAFSALVVFMVLLNQYFLMLIPVYAILVTIIIFYAIYLFKRQNLNSLKYDCGQLFVKYNNRTITIPIQTIKSIKRGIGGLDFKLQLTITYKLGYGSLFLLEILYGSLIEPIIQQRNL